MRFGWSIFFVIIFFSCSDDPISEDFLFQKVPATRSGIDFRNDLIHTERLNTYTYRNFYNGAGVAVGDINNDGLIDIYFAGNQVDNKLYLNKGNFQFEDITAKAGVACENVWSTGVSMADVNGDGLLDIYVCKSGPPEGPNRFNELFINNGDLTFTEKAKEFGVADKGLSFHAAFFDFDKDDDLDFYLLNNSLRSVGAYDLKEGQREIRDPFGGNKLYRNDGDTFTDVSKEAGIYSSAIGFGLGVTIADVNRDGWQDIFVSNDFFERDYLYINNQDGTFDESLEELTTEISMGSMGADIADLTNDGYPEIYVTEMLPSSQGRVKTKTNFEDWDKYQSNVQNGYFHQFTRNALQLNLGPIDGKPYFSELSRLTGLHATDWSWGALIWDFNNDGNKDIYVANGIYKDLTDQDYVNFYSSNNDLINRFKKDSLVLTKMIDAIPSVPLPNHLFQNFGDLKFDDKAKELGLGDSTFSNGAAYGDLDNDGDLDLIVNNVNAPADIFENTLQAGNSIQLDLKGIGKNTFAFGTQVIVWTGGKSQFFEQTPVKGYLSSIDHRLHIGLGDAEKVDSLKVIWPDGNETILKDIIANQILEVSQKENRTNIEADVRKKRNTLFNKSEIQLDFQHQENDFIDFNRDRLLFEMYSTEGPKASKGDVNGDGLEDLFIGGAKGQTGSLFIQKHNGTFSKANEPFEGESGSEDIGSIFFDADGDDDLDLYVASGGNEFSKGSRPLVDRLYLNDGKGNFQRKENFIETQIRESTSFVEALDFDNDGDKDLVIGIRLRAFLYGVPMGAVLLENQGDATFKNVTVEIAPDFQQIGLVTDGEVVDIDGDSDQDLVLVGHWMPITIFINEGGKFIKSNSTGLESTKGLWNTIEVSDLNNDGRPDLVAGNHGVNSRYRASEEKPLCLHINDFDKNGTVDHIICQFEGDKSYPIVRLAELVKQLPGLRKKYLKTDDYKNQTIEDLFDEEARKNTIRLETQSLRTSVFLNKNGAFEKIDLPQEAQFSPVFAIKIADFNFDGNSDIILGGNLSSAKPEWGVYRASYGNIFLGSGDGNFSHLPAQKSGILIKGDVRDIELIKVGNQSRLVFIRNNDKPEVFNINEEKGKI